MARERLLDQPVVVTKNGVPTEYPLVRLLNSISVRVQDNHAHQVVVIQWAIGKADAEGNFEALGGAGLTGSKTYDNQGSAPSFDQLIGSSASLGSFMDNIFADLEAEGQIGPGTDRDYAMPS